MYSSDSFLLHWYLEKFWKPKKNTLEDFLFQYSKDIADFSVLQIGANDGLVNDPICKLIRKEKWTGVLLEPQELVYNKYLVPLYKNYSKIKLMNNAIASNENTADLYVISFSAERWATGLASFVKSSIEGKIADGYVDKCIKKYNEKAPAKKEDYIKTQQVKCVSFESVFKSSELKKIDLLQIDTEGFDFEIIKMFPFDKIKPGVISYESERLSSADILACESYLKKQGYNVSGIERDSVAVLM
jgi:FkbM family methyltransferase